MQIYTVIKVDKYGDVFVLQTTNSIEVAKETMTKHCIDIVQQYPSNANSTGTLNENMMPDIEGHVNNGEYESFDGSVYLRRSVLS